MDRVEVCRSIAAVDTLFRFIVINKFASKVRSVRFGSVRFCSIRFVVFHPGRDDKF